MYLTVTPVIEYLPREHGESKGNLLYMSAPLPHVHYFPSVQNLRESDLLPRVLYMHPRETEISTRVRP
jgi:hypothetical protein